MPHRFFILAYNSFLDTLFPWKCTFCQKESEFNYPLCQNCLLKIQLFNQFICPVCHKRLFNPNKTCHFNPLKALGVVGFYEDEILKEVILTFKYKKIKSLVLPLASLMIYFLKNNSYFLNLQKENLVIIPIPLHQKREQLRGFNQTELLALKVSAYFSIELLNNVLVRIKNNPPQAEIKNLNEREKNIKGVFEIKNLEKIKNKTILLIDDVYTTGATLNEAAKILKQNGAKSIIGVVLAKS
ncbi:MAG: ComF family protein [Minisyncoccia bacterium]